VADPNGAVRRVERIGDGRRETGKRAVLAGDVDGRPTVEDDEDARVAGRPALGGDDRVPLLVARDARDARLDPAEDAWIVEVRAQGTWGSISP
jgi:hypothetical protein